MKVKEKFPNVLLSIINSQAVPYAKKMYSLFKLFHQDPTLKQIKTLLSAYGYRYKPATKARLRAVSNTIDLSREHIDAGTLLVYWDGSAQYLLSPSYEDIYSCNLRLLAYQETLIVTGEQESLEEFEAELLATQVLSILDKESHLIY